MWDLFIPGSLMGAYSHIISPDALYGRLPTDTMRTWGFRVLVGTLLASAFVAGVAADLW